MLEITELNNTSAREINKIIFNAGILLWPSGGVYGLACSAYDKNAVDRLYAAKDRDFTKPLSIIASCSTANNFANLTLTDKKIIHSLWPDFIGIIAKKKKIVPDFVTSGMDTVGLVCSSNVNIFLAEKIILPLASTSANLSGRPEITSPYEAKKIFKDIADAIIISENNNSALNTLVSTRDGFKVIREGKFTRENILSLLN